MRRMRMLALFPLIVLLAGSCREDSRRRLTLLPNVTGRAGEVVAVLSEPLWQEGVGRALQEVMRREYPMLPQAEPMFDLVTIPPHSFTGIFRTHRNIVLLKVGDEHQQAQILAQRDVWATPQLVLNIVGPTYPAIERMLLAEADRLIQLIEQAERERVIQNAVRFEVQPLRHLLERQFDIAMHFPRGYQLRLDTTDFVWISYDTPEISQGVFVYQFPYTDPNTFTPEYLIGQRNRFVRAFVPGPTPGTHMTTAGAIPPRFTPMMFNGRYFAQLRGLWEVRGHPMGGPFVSMATLHEASGKVVVVEGYVFAPSVTKRNPIRRVEALLFALDVGVENR